MDKYTETRLWPCSIQCTKAMWTLEEPLWSPPEKPSKLEQVMDLTTGLPKFDAKMRSVVEDKDPDIYKLEMQIYLANFNQHKK